MANRRPVGEFGSIREALLAQMARGLDVGAAARVVAMARGRRPDDRGTHRYARDIALHQGDGSLSLMLEAGAFTALAREAAHRGETPTGLARRLIETALSQDLVNAILDDGDDA